MADGADFLALFGWGSAGGSWVETCLREAFLLGVLRGDGLDSKVEVDFGVG